MLGMKLGADGRSRLALCRSCELWLLLAIPPLMDTDTHTQIHTHTHTHIQGKGAESRFHQLDNGRVVDHSIIDNHSIILICSCGRCSWLMRPNGKVIQWCFRADSRIWGKGTVSVCAGEKRKRVKTLTAFLNMQLEEELFRYLHF